MINIEDRLLNIKKVLKYLFLGLLIIIPIIFILNSGSSYKKIEKKMKELASIYIKENNILINKETYIELSFLDEIEGTELCSNASGIIVNNINGKLEYTPYLICDDYETKIINNKNKYLKLNDKEVIVLNKNEVYNDSLYYLKKEADVIIDGEVGQNPGIYTISYNASVDNRLKETAIRKVIIIEKDKNSNLSGLSNKKEPIITLIGDKNITLRKGEKYIEPGYLAFDYEDGKITRKVAVTPKKFSTDLPGKYTITYSITNSKGMTSTNVRIINVVESKSNLEITVTNSNNGFVKNNPIIISISGSGFNYMIKPDNTKSLNNTETYIATQNQNYVFKVFDIYGNEYLKEIEITNIDDELPKGTCKAKISGGTEVTVDATDNNGISGYSYIIDGKSTEYIKYKNYNDYKIASSVSVDIQDLAGNVQRINCELDKSVVISNPTEVISCHGDRTLYNNQIEQIVQKNGSRTRKTATALGVYLSTQIGVKIPYFWAGGHWHYSWDGHDNPEMFKGVSPEWGCPLKNMKDGRLLPAGFDCTGFIAWILFNSGFKKSEIGSFSGKNALTRLGGKKLELINFAGSTGKVKAGDIVWREGHMVFVIEVSGKTVTIAHAKGTAWGLIVEKYSSETGRQIGGSSKFSKVTIMDNYYK